MAPSGHIVGYARVSTVDQKLDRQLALIGTVDRMFTDHVSGSTRSRPGLTEMLAYVRQGDRVRVASLDRLARSVPDLEALVDELTGKGVTVEFISNGLTFSAEENDPFAVFQRQMLGAFAQFERALIRERQREGIEAAKARGVYKGRRPALNSAQVATARQRYANGESMESIAQAMGCSRRVVFDVVNYRGAYDHGDQEKKPSTPRRQVTPFSSTVVAKPPKQPRKMAASDPLALVFKEPSHS
ncbi:recombinase family protein [Dermatophilus congolensis]|nr:recombinase family protein [Dermatophilus congolensis]MBO3146342.1 recombinase family protein [Dermatophilus congolensis]MBO3148615.1 recombinase family protein [Dermatophilus congolensis]MBO3157579.1 recombinase family protein [Dermatophilus congolensis]MBO3159859.1 recombinase family protein [Dermatophilus congolensis]MBO3166598.1 recombinase family protein [Dermatophilus congolensis]